jgi:CTP:phosphocholine cytidylyltransferase-like protein
MNAFFLIYQFFCSNSKRNKLLLKKEHIMANNKLSKKQFQILVHLEKCKEKKPQREIAEACDMSVGSINRAMAELCEHGFVFDGLITQKGYEALEPYRVKRAIFIAAGFGSRLVPITLNTPKPLVRVNGTRMIDTLLDAVVAAEIEEIYIVRGYLGEQFDQLLYKYPNIKFIDNPLYNEANNISSAMCARHLLQNAYVLEADLVLYNPNLIQKYQYTSNYLGVPVDKTDDWCFETKNKVITKLKIGGENCHHTYGISYWNSEDGLKLFDDIKKVYEMPGGKERYWDQVSLEYCIDNYSVEVRPCSFDDIIEIDSYSDLKRIDSTYC